MKRISNLSRLLGMLLVVAMMACSLTFGVSAASHSEITPSIVLVRSENQVYHATGVIIGIEDGVAYIVTSTNVLGNDGSSNPIVNFFSDENTFSKSHVRYRDDKKEIVVLAVERAPEDLTACTFAYASEVTADSNLAGFCYSSDINPVKLGSDDLVLKKHSVSVVSTETRENNSVFKVEMSKIASATVGSPIVNEDGKIVGILIDANKSHVLYSDEIIEVLEAEGFPYSTGGLSFITLIIIGAAVLIVIIILVVILVVSKNKKNVEERAFSNNTVGYINPSNDVSAVNSPAPQQPAASMRVISRGGALNGKTYSVTGSAKIGRDASRCTITYPVNTQGVSGCHCELTFDGSVCYLKDMKSSFGTFLSDGTRLAPFAPQILRSGDSFYLAGPENTFEVRF